MKLNFATLLKIIYGASFFVVFSGCNNNGSRYDNVAQNINEASRYVDMMDSARYPPVWNYLPGMDNHGNELTVGTISSRLKIKGEAGDLISAHLTLIAVVFTYDEKKC